MAAFAAVQNTGATLSWRAGPFAFDICDEWQGKIGGWDDRAQALGGWTLSAHHAYDPRAQTLYRGDGERTSASDHNRLVLNWVIGNGSTYPAPAEGAQARSVAVPAPYGLAAGPDGSVYFQADGNIWKTKPDGTITNFVPYSSMVGLGQLALAPPADGRLYISDSGNGSYPGRLLRRENDGTVSTLYTLPTSNSANSGLAIGPEGAVYFSDSHRHRVMRRGTDGSVGVVAGLANATAGGYSGDGGLATLAQLNYPGALAVGLDGTLYIADTINSRVRAVGTDGIIRTVAGGQPCGGECGYFLAAYSNDGALAVQAGIGTPTSLAVARDGTLYIGEDLQMVRRVTPDGIINTIASSENYRGTCSLQTVDCVPTGSQTIPIALALEASGDLLMSSGSGAIARISSGFTVAKGINEQYVPSSDGSEIYVFDLAGRHLRTLDGLTTAVLLSFGHDLSGRLTSITDRDGNVTSVQRDAQGNPTAIASPYGQTTTLSVDGNGYLASITNPNQESVQLQYKPPVSGDYHTGGLLSQLTDPRSGVHLFEHDANGFLTKDTPPDGAYQSLDRGGSLAPIGVTHTTALGRKTLYGESWEPDSKTESSFVKGPDGLATSTVTKGDYSTSTTSPDGMQSTTTATPDPRFGMDAFTVSATAKTPSGLTATMRESRTATMMSATDPLTLKTLLAQTSVNGKTFASIYDRGSSTVTSTTPAGRTAVATLDSLGRVTQVQPPGVLPLQVQYDSRGRLLSVAQGSRAISYSYDAQGNLASLTDPLGRQVSFAYDLAGRTTRQVFPDGRTIFLAYDASGNVTSVTPPGRPSPSFAYTPADLEQSYPPPNLGFQSTTQTAYDLDRAVSLISRPAGDSIVPSYDPVKGRLTSVAFNAGTNSFSYSATSGNLSSIAAADGTGLAYGYDGPLLTSVSWSGTSTGTVSKSYDSNFRLASEQVNTGAAVAYAYDADSLLARAGALTIAREAASGFVTGSTLGNVTDSVNYNSYGEPQTYSANYGTTALYSADYGTRDGLGRIVTKTETVQGVSHIYGYSYDAVGQLIDVTQDGVLASHYAYDANANRTSGPGLAASPAYDLQDRLLSYGDCTYGYKADGSLQAQTCGAATTSYVYDALGNLRHVTLPSGTNIDYLIDGQDRRVGKKVNGTLIEGFLYRNQFQPSAWLNGDGSVKATFVYGGKPNMPEYIVQGGVTYRLVTDQVGSVRLVVNASTGAIAERIDYDEFGVVLADSAPGFQPFGFGGGMYDRDTGLVRFGARDYDSRTGRWAAKEPLGFRGSLNFYQYVDGDPVNFQDPTGLAKVGDVVFFNWSGVAHPQHAAIVTEVDGDGNPTHAFGGWEDTMTFHEVDLNSYNGGIAAKVIGTGDMTGLNSLSLSDFEAVWNGTAVAPGWHGNVGNVCIDAATSKGGYGGPKLRSAMAADFKKHPKSYKTYTAGKADPKTSLFYRRNPWLWQFFKNTGRWN